MRVQPVELQLADELLGERAARAFGKDGDFRAQFVSGREVVFRFAVLVHAFIFGEDAGDAVFVVEQFPAGKLREEVHALFFDEAAEPFHQLVERDDVVAMILQRRRSDGKFVAAGFGEVVGRVAGNGSVERSGFFEVRDELAQSARVHDRAGKLVRADFAAFFQDVDIFGGERGRFFRFVVLFDQIREVQGAGEAAGTGADDEDIGIELFALDAGGVGHGAILAEEENGKEKMESWCEMRALSPEIVESGDFGELFAASGWRAEGAQKYRIEMSRFKLLIMGDLSSAESGKRLQTRRMEICALLIMRELSFLEIAKNREKYRIEIPVLGAASLGGTLGLRYRLPEFGVRLVAEDEMSKIFTNYGSTMRAKLRTVVCVRGGTI